MCKRCAPEWKECVKDGNNNNWVSMKGIEETDWRHNMSIYTSMWLIKKYIYTSMCPNARDFQTGNGRTPLELSSWEKLLISGFLFFRPLVTRSIAWKRGDWISLAKAAWLACTLKIRQCRKPELSIFLQETQNNNLEKFENSNFLKNTSSFY